MGEEQFRYAAFISYRHEPLGRKWAIWLQRVVEQYRVPSSLVKAGKAPKRIGRVFRDEEELSVSADLSREIDQALQESKFLIVVCTPRTPHSRWVNQEIQRFRDLGRGDRILALLVEGEPRESFPPALVEIRRPTVDAAGNQSIHEIEPLAADVRGAVSGGGGHGVGHARSTARTRLIAALLGVRFDELRNRELRRRQAQLLTMGVVALAVAAGLGGLSIYAFGQRNLVLQQKAEVQQQRDKAERQRKEADRQRLETELAENRAVTVRNFVLDILSYPASPEAAGVNTTILEMLHSADSRAARMEEGSRLETSSEAEIRKALGQTYLRLNRLAEAEAQFRREVDLRIAGRALDTTAADASRRLASVLLALGRGDEAETTIRTSLAAVTVRFGAESAAAKSASVDLCDFLLLANPPRTVEAEPLFKSTLDQRTLMLAADIETGGSAVPEDLLPGVSAGSDLAVAAMHFYDSKAVQEGSASETATAPASRRSVSTEVLARVALSAAAAERGGEAATAENLSRLSVQLSSEKLGWLHPFTLQQVSQRARALDATGRAAEGDALFAEMMAKIRTVSGSDSRVMLWAEAARLDRLEGSGRWKESISPRQVLFEQQQKLLGPYDPRTLASLVALAEGMVHLQRSDEAISLLRGGVEEAERSLGANAQVVAQLRASVQELEKLNTALAKSGVLYIVKAVTGTAQYRSSDVGEWKVMTPGLELYSGATVRTALRTAVELTTPDGTVVTLDRLGVYPIRPGVFGPDNGLRYGRTRFDVGEAANNHDRAVRTSSGTLQIRN